MYTVFISDVLFTNHVEYNCTVADFRVDLLSCLLHALSFVLENDEWMLVYVLNRGWYIFILRAKNFTLFKVDSRPGGAYYCIMYRIRNCDPVHFAFVFTCVVT